MQRKYNIVLFITLLTVWASVNAGPSAKSSGNLSNGTDTAEINRLNAYGKSILATDPDKASRILNTSIKKSERLDYPQGAGIAQLHTGNIYTLKGDYRQALACYKKAAGNFTLSGSVKDIGSAHLGMGSVFSYLNKTDSSIYYFQKAIETFEDNNLQKQLASALGSLGALYHNVENYPKAITYLNKSISISRAVKDSAELIQQLSNLSVSYTGSKDFRQAYAYASEGVRIAKLFRNERLLYYALDLYSSACTDMNRTDEAIQVSRKCINYARAAGHTQLYLSFAITMANALHKMGDFRSEIIVLETALKESERIDDIFARPEILTALAGASYSMGDYKKAYDYNEKAGTFRNSRINEDNRRAVEELAVKYETSQKKKALADKQLQISAQKMQIQKSRELTIFSLAAGIMAILVASFVYFAYRNRKKIHERQLKNMQQETEIQLLQALMQGEEQERQRLARDLHDGVGGTLAATKMHLSVLQNTLMPPESINKLEHTSALLDSVSNEIRTIAHNLSPDILLNCELDSALAKFCKRVSSESLHVDFMLIGDPPHLKDSFKIVIYRTVQEIISNIIKHAEASVAIVQMSHHNKLISFTIEDNGKGFDLNSAPGLGTMNLKARVQDINGSISVESSRGNGTTVYLEFDTSAYETKKTVPELAG